MSRAEAESGTPVGPSGWDAHPFIYEINTWAWLDSISSQEGRPIDLGSVPSGLWDEVAAVGCDAV